MSVGWSYHTDIWHNDSTLGFIATTRVKRHSTYILHNVMLSVALLLLPILSNAFFIVMSSVFILSVMAHTGNTK